MGVREISVRCCIAGGGPAGMMLGLLLARAGVTVLVLEKHVDFLRDFRGDTIHPSTLEIMHELGVLDEFLQRPHQEVRTLGAQVGEVFLQVADFEHLPTHCRFVALMPQWDFLNFIAEQTKRYPGFRLEMEAEATALIEEGGRVTGLRAETSQGSLAVRADLVVGADGRHSIVREKAGLEITNLGAPMDVLWMRLSRHPSDPGQTLGRVGAGRIFMMLNRGDYWQCAYVIRKGGFDQIRRSGLTAFRDEVVRLAPYLSDRAGELADWSDIKLLTVAVDRLRVWHRSGVLCIGDAAHAMSPIGGVGINLAIQDAVASPTSWARVFASGPQVMTTCARFSVVGSSRPVRRNGLQIFIQNRVIGRVLEKTGQLSPPLAVRLLGQCSFLRRIPARLVGLGFRPEHVMSPAAA